jgi:hypothetical protein
MQSAIPIAGTRKLVVPVSKRAMAFLFRGRNPNGETEVKKEPFIDSLLSLTEGIKQNATKYVTH